MNETMIEIGPNEWKYTTIGQLIKLDWELREGEHAEMNLGLSAMIGIFQKAVESLKNHPEKFEKRPSLEYSLRTDIVRFEIYLANHQEYGEMKELGNRARVTLREHVCRDKPTTLHGTAMVKIGGEEANVMPKYETGSELMMSDMAGMLSLTH